MKKIIDLLTKISNIFAYIAEFLRKSQFHEEYYVYVPNNDKPRYIHKSYKSARDEARRLKSKLSSCDFIEILQIVNRFEGE